MPLAWFPYHILTDLRECGAWPGGKPRPYIALNVEVRNDAKVATDVNVVGMTLDAFLEGVSPKCILRLSENI